MSVFERRAAPVRRVQQSLVREDLPSCEDGERVPGQNVQVTLGHSPQQVLVDLFGTIGFEDRLSANDQTVHYIDRYDVRNVIIDYTKVTGVREEHEFYFQDYLMKRIPVLRRARFCVLHQDNYADALITVRRLRSLGVSVSAVNLNSLDFPIPLDRRT